MTVTTMDNAEILRLRQDLDWTQERLAEELAVSRSTVARWELEDDTNLPSGPALRLLEQLRIRADHELRKKISRRG